MNDFLTISKGSCLFIRRNLICSGFYLRNFLLLAKVRFLSRTANKTCANLSGTSYAYTLSITNRQMNKKHLPSMTMSLNFHSCSRKRAGQ